MMNFKNPLWASLDFCEVDMLMASFKYPFTMLLHEYNLFYYLSGCSILGNEELAILSSWVQEFLYDFTDTCMQIFYC